MDYRCPRCRSLIRLKWSYSLKAPALQELVCPVCGQIWWLSSDYLPLPKIWLIDKIIERNEIPEITSTIANVSVPASLQKPVYSEFRILPEGFIENASENIKSVAIWVVIVLILIYLIVKR